MSARKILTVVLVLAAGMLSSAHAASNSSACGSEMKADDVLVELENKDGSRSTYLRRQALEVAARIRADVAIDPTLTEAPDWRAEYATDEYWVVAQQSWCSGTKNCSSQSGKDPNKSCEYKSTGKFSGCKCE